MQTRDREWLEADGLGGYASGTASLVRTRRYHALLVAATTPPTGRAVLVAGFDAVVEWRGLAQPISRQAYESGRGTGAESRDEAGSAVGNGLGEGVGNVVGEDLGVLAPADAAPIEAFEWEPWPRWTFRLRDGARLVQEIFAIHDSPRVAVSFALVDEFGRPLPGRVRIRPFLAARDDHALSSAGPERDRLLEPPERLGEQLVFATLGELPSIGLTAKGCYVHDPHWYRSFLLVEERRRGFDHHEDLASPGELVLELEVGRAGWIVEAVANGRHPGEPAGEGRSRDPGERPGEQRGGSAEQDRGAESGTISGASLDFEVLRAGELRRRAGLGGALDRAADAYLVRRGAGRSIVAGYPWFTDWGRDTFISLRGLCLARGELATARDILLEWAGVVDGGVLPNRFADRGEAPEYNSVDASLWYVVCVEELLRAWEQEGRGLAENARSRLARAVDAILCGHARGARHGIRLDRDGLLAAGEPGVQLTWMDARVGDLVVTPRIGKPVEIQALWWNALRCGSRFDGRWAPLAARAQASFAERFWNAELGMLHDVVDADHVPGRVDPSFRPNQLFAVGGLPFALLEGERAAQIVLACEKSLWTPAGIRSLAPGDTAYVPRYAGGPSERDLAYHQGTVWPWLAGAFVEGWLRVRGFSAEARDEAARRFLEPLRARLAVSGLGHLPEIADAEAPHDAAGCPFQAWSLAELLRLERVVLADAPRS